MKTSLVTSTLLCAGLFAACASSGYSPKVSRRSTSLVEGRLLTELLFTFREEQWLVSYTGRIELARDEADLVALGEGARLEIVQLSGAFRRRLVASRSEAGEVALDTYIDGRRVVADNAGDAWRAAMLRELVQRVDLGGAARGERLLAEGGASALLDHLEFSTHGRFAASYLPLVLRDEGLDDSALPTVVRRAARVCPSSSTLAEFLVEVCDRAPAERELGVAILEACAAVGSDAARSEVLAALALRRELDGELTLEWIAAVGCLGSAASRTYALAALADSDLPLESWRAAWLAAVAGSTRARQRAELYLQCLARPDCDASARIDVARAARALASVALQREVLDALLGAGMEDEGVFEATLALIAALNSSEARESGLLALLERDELEPWQLRAMDSVARRLASSEARARVGECILERLPAGD